MFKFSAVNYQVTVYGPTCKHVWNIKTCYYAEWHHILKYMLLYIMQTIQRINDVVVHIQRKYFIYQYSSSIFRSLKGVVNKCVEEKMFDKVLFQN